MKQFSYGDVVPGCKAVFRAEREQAVLERVAEYAIADYALTVVPQAMPDQVRDLRLNLPAVA